MYLLKKGKDYEKYTIMCLSSTFVILVTKTLVHLGHLCSHRRSLNFCCTVCNVW
jgi:hypothetical protein